MPKRITNVVILKGGKTEIFRYDHDGRQALELLIGGPEYADARVRDTLGWRRAEALEDVRSAACVDFDRKELVLGGDFGLVRVDEDGVFVSELDLCRALLPYWPSWTLRYAPVYPVELVVDHAENHELTIPSNKPLVTALRHPWSDEDIESLDEITDTFQWREELKVTPPPARLSAEYRDVLLTRIDSLSFRMRVTGECARAGLLFVGDVVSATAAELDEGKVSLATRASLFDTFRSDFNLDLPTTLPAFLDKALQRAHGWKLPVELPSEWNDWRRQARG